MHRKKCYYWPADSMRAVKDATDVWRTRVFVEKSKVRDVDRDGGMAPGFLRLGDLVNRAGIVAGTSA